MSSHSSNTQVRPWQADSSSGASDESLTGGSTSKAAPLAGAAYHHLLEDLTSLKLEPGDRLTVDSLARQYAISQTPIREALARLETEGLVVKNHMRGYRAAPSLDAAAFSELFAFRSVIEPAAAAWAASNADSADRTTLRTLLEQMRTRAQERGYGEFAVLDASFHGAIAASARNRALRDALDRLHAHLHLFRVRRDSDVADAAVDEHVLIVDAIERADPILAEAAMRSHITRSASRLTEAVRK